jgi:hypothetical protein
MEKHEALEIIEKLLIEIDVQMLMNHEDLIENDTLSDTKWILLDAQARILGGNDPVEVMKTVMEL